MKDYKELLETLCKRLEWSLNAYTPLSDLMQPKRTVEFNYSHGISGGGFVFQARIDVDNVCSFRETVWYDLPDKKEASEIKVFERLLDATFCYGVMAARKELDALLLKK